MPAHNLIHGGDVYTAMENGLNGRWFSANIGPLGLPPAVAEAARRAVGSCDTYPDPLCRRLTAALAEAEGVPADWIGLRRRGGGVAVPFCRCAAAEKGVAAGPGFAEYEQALAAAGCEIVFHSLRREDGFLPTSALLEAIGPDIDAVMLCNPHNPTGALMSPDFCRAAADRCGRRGRGCSWMSASSI